MRGQEGDEGVDHSGTMEKGAQNSAHKKKQGSCILGSMYKVRKGKAESLKNSELLGM